MPYFWYINVEPRIGANFCLEGVLWDGSLEDALLDLYMWIQQGHIKWFSNIGYES